MRICAQPAVAFVEIPAASVFVLLEALFVFSTETVVEVNVAEAKGVARTRL